MTSEAKISIVIAAYKGEKYIAEQLKSLLAQTRLPDEIIICDDSNDDLTCQAISEFCSGGMVKYTKNSEALGVAGNFEKAISLASGDYIFLCDQDDVWHPEKVETMAALLDENSTVDGVFCNSMLVDGKLESLHKTLWDLRKFTPAMQRTLAAGEALKVFCCRVVCSGHNIAFRRRALEYIMPFPELAPFYPDTWIALAIALNGSWLAVDRCLTSYRIHDSNRSNPAGNALKAAKKSRSCSAAGRNRLLAVELLERCQTAAPEKRKMLQEFALHHQTRESYSGKRFIRLFQAAGELLRGGYKKYSNNLRTFIADIIFKP